MDGSSFIIDEQTQEHPTLEAPVLEAAPIVPSRTSSVDKDHWLSVACAAFAHMALIFFLLVGDSDAIGDEGVALETIAVSIVETVPAISAPETKPTDASELRPDAEEPAAETAPQLQQQEERKETATPTLTLDLPPEPVPLPDLPTLPTRQSDAKPEPRDVALEQPPDKPADKPAETTAANSASVAIPTGALPQFSSAEAAPGVVRAYARQISGILDRNKPRARGLTGEVKVQFVINAEGKPQTAKLLATSGNPRLDDLVLGAVLKMEFPSPPREMSLMQRTFNVPFAYRIAR